MDTFGGSRDYFFWGVTFIAIINVFLVIVSAVHHKDFWVRLPLLTILLAVVVIWVASLRLQNGLYKVCSDVDEEAVLRQQSVAHTMAFTANLAILSLFHFSTRRMYGRWLLQNPVALVALHAVETAISERQTKASLV